MRFLAWRNDPSDGTDPLARSAHRHNVSLEYIGQGRPFRGLVSKLDWLGDALVRIEPSEIVVCTDAYDVVYVAGEREILAGFLSYGCRVLISGERWYSHQAIDRKGYFDAVADDSPYRYLNSGSLMGYCGELQEMIQQIRKDRKTHPRQSNDQWFVGKFYCEHAGAMTIDTKCKVFWCIAGEWECAMELARFSGPRVMNSTTGEMPGIVHIPWLKKYSHVYNELVASFERRQNSETSSDLPK